MQNVRHARFALFRNPATPGGTPSRVDSGSDLGTFQVGGFSRFVGMFQSVGSLTLQWRMGVHSGDYQVTSSMVINSGNVIFDQLNYGVYVNFTITAANSQTPKYLMIGEPLR